MVRRPIRHTEVAENRGRVGRDCSGQPTYRFCKMTQTKGVSPQTGRGPVVKPEAERGPWAIPSCARFGFGRDER